MRAFCHTAESWDPKLPSKRSPSRNPLNFSSRWKSGCGPGDSNKASYLVKKKKGFSSFLNQRPLTSLSHWFHGWHRRSTEWHEGEIRSSLQVFFSLSILALYSNFRNYAPPPFLPQICPPFFWGQFSQNSLLGDAWLKASLVHQHTLCHPPKMWALQVSKNGRTVKSIYSHNIFSSFATKKWHFYRKYAYDKMGLGIFTEKKLP